MIRPLKLATMAALLALAACASAPTQYHTLVPPAAANTAAAPAGFAIEVLPVSVPAQVDQPQLVLRQGASDVVMLDSQRWLAPLGDEVRGALAADLSSLLGTHDVNGLPQPKGSNVVRIKLDVRRFDSELGGTATLEAAWTVRKVGSEAVTACASSVSEPAGSGYGELVQAHQRALARVAGSIAQAARAVARGESATCPVGNAG
jgi:uncharacterized lipoprotein YmbA